MKKLMFFIYLLFFAFLNNSYSEEQEIINKSINALLKEGYKIMSDEIIIGDEFDWGTKVITLRKRNNYIVCTLILNTVKPRPSKCLKP